MRNTGTEEILLVLGYTAACGWIGFCMWVMFCAAAVG